MFLGEVGQQKPFFFNITKLCSRILANNIGLEKGHGMKATGVLLPKTVLRSFVHNCFSKTVPSFETETPIFMAHYFQNVHYHRFRSVFWGKSCLLTVFLSNHRRRYTLTTFYLLK